MKRQPMTPDMCVPCGDGLLNIRVGAIIQRDGRFLMVRNARSDYFYSVGGRIKFGETAEEAVVREVLEWVAPDEPRTVYPGFFRRELDPEDMTVKHLVCDDRP